MTMPAMRGEVKPTVFITAISPVRSRMAPAMALPTMSRMVTKEAPITPSTMRPILPCWSTKAALKASSVVVRVSARELANSVSISLMMRSFWSLPVVMTWMLPIWSLAKARPSSKYS